MVVLSQRCPESFDNVERRQLHGPVETSNKEHRHLVDFGPDLYVEREIQEAVVLSEMRSVLSKVMFYPVLLRD